MCFILHTQWHCALFSLFLRDIFIYVTWKQQFYKSWKRKGVHPFKIGLEVNNMIHKVHSLRFTKEDHVRLHKFDKIIHFSAFVRVLLWDLHTMRSKSMCIGLSLMVICEMLKTLHPWEIWCFSRCGLQFSSDENESVDPPVVSQPPAETVPSNDVVPFPTPKTG